MQNVSRVVALSLGLSLCTASQAMHLNPAGTGEVLLFPYYTVNADQQTIISVANTTDKAKILQIVFREGFNGREAVSFAIALGPHDSWSAATFSLAVDGPANLLTTDTSCTAPLLDASSGLPQLGGRYYVPFLTYAYVGPNADGGPSTLARTREGFVEVIERAELSGSLASAVTLTNGQRQCNRIQQIDPNSSELLPPSGGLKGSFAVVDVPEGTILGGTAVAIDEFSVVPLFSDTTSEIDWLGQGNSGPGTAEARILAGNHLTGYSINAMDIGRSIDPVSALLMTDSLQGDFGREATLGSNTEWVITAPTKRFYTDRQRLGSGPARLPFTNVFNVINTSASCMRVVPRAFDREGRAITFWMDPEFSVPPPGSLPQFSLCHNTDVVYFAPESISGGTPVLGSRLGTKVWNPSPVVETGSMQLNLGATETSELRAYLPPGSPGTGLRGLPVIGFQAVKYINGNVTPGVLANYTVATPLQTTVTCVSGTGTLLTCP